MRNNLWYHYLNNALPSTKPPSQSGASIIRNMSYPALFELWHLRLGHPGTKIIEQIHKHVIGIPLLRGNKFYNCSSCMYGKFCNKPISKNKSTSTQKSDMHTTTTTTTTTTQQQQQNFAAVGQHLHMDYGFVRGSDWSRKENDGKLVTSIDKYRSYLLVIDRYSRYIWIYLTKSKHPPIEKVQGLLKQFNTYKYATITIDRGGELSNSFEFQKMIDTSNYVLRSTGSYTSAQNGMAEKPNQDLAQIM